MIDAVRSAIARTFPEVGDPPQVLLRHGGGGVRDTDLAIVLDDLGRTFAAVKTARGERACALLRGEHERLARLAATLLLLRPGGAPRPLGFHEGDDQAFLVQSYLPGRRLKDLDPRETDRARGAVDETVSWLIDLARTTGIERGDLHAMVADPVARYLGTFETSAAERALLGALETSLHGAFGADAPVVLRHGDLADANVLVDGAVVGVVDWDEPASRGLPGGDLYHFLASLAATRAGLDDAQRMRRGFVEAFFAPTRVAARNRRRVERYRDALKLPRSALFPLFVLAWVQLALHKMEYLEESGLRDAPGSSFPITVISENRCLNVAWAAELGDAFEL